MGPRQFSSSRHDALVAELALHPPKTVRIGKLEDLDTIPFVNGVASVMVAARLLPLMPFKNHLREPSPRLEALRASIRRNGFTPVEPIIVRVGQRGRWVVVDGGHRLTALLGEIASPVQRYPLLRALFGRRMGDVYFLVYLTPRSWRKSGMPSAIRVD